MAVSSTERTSRLAANASQMINKNMITASNDTKEPMEETVFHRV